jgi:predicted PhzF superfamily epimerase YddE/YHI9
MTKSGLLTCTPGEDGWIQMDFPADPLTTTVAPTTLGMEGIRWCGRGRRDFLIELSDAATVRALEPDQGAIAALGVRCLIVTAGGDGPDVDCVSRVFAPGAGIAEDPVTGSAHCTLASFWAGRLGRNDLVGEQASPRGGIVRMKVAGDRVILGGRAVTVSTVRMLV